jgi:hypothetical protein
VASSLLIYPDLELSEMIITNTLQNQNASPVTKAFPYLKKKGKAFGCCCHLKVTVEKKGGYI